MVAHQSHQGHKTFAEQFRRLGLRITTPRLLVMEALASTDGHMTADAIMEWTSARYPAINLTTIYRTLEVLSSAGLVTQTNMGTGASEYELATDTPHHHLVCDQCGVAIEIDDAPFMLMRNHILKEYGFNASTRHLGLFGTCSMCSPSGSTQHETGHTDDLVPEA